MMTTPGQAPTLILPGRFAKEQQDAKRPLDYVEQDEQSGRIYIVANAREIESRIPIDELKAMLQDRKRKAISRGDAQRAADVNASLREFWDSRKMWVKDRQNNAIRFGWTPGASKL